MSKIVDIHTHVFPEKIVKKTIEKLEEKGGIKAKAAGTEAGLLAEMKQSGVDISVIMPVVTRAEQFSSVNAYAEKLNRLYEKEEKRLFSFGGIHPDAINYKQQLRSVRDMGLKGIKLHPDYQGTFIDDPKYMRIIDYATEIGLTILVHAGVDIGFRDLVRCSPERIRNVLDSVGPERFILGHYGGYEMWDEVEELLVGENVYLDTAMIFPYISDEQFLRILKKHGADKIVYGTDSPWSSQKETLEIIKRLVPQKEEQEKILGENICKILGF